MAKNILDEIVEKRREDIARLGFTFGVSLPEKRVKSVKPFVPGGMSGGFTKSAILEVKRASPSKGDIAPNLCAGETAKKYEISGAGAISVLTERNFFKGSLEDLIEVSSVVSSAAVLRKDFLLEEEEIEVSYKCGADAVLLIARILDDKKLISMAKTCEKFGMTAFIELRLSDDIRKLSLVCNEVDKKFIVCGVNARDLRDFKIDLLTPLGVFEEIRSVLGKDARVVFESGIRTPSASFFVGSLGFTGMLLGEAAAKNPSKAKSLVDGFLSGEENPDSIFFLDFAKKIKERKMLYQTSCVKVRPFVKICGLTNIYDAKLALDAGADFLGFIFSSKSPRNVSAETVLKTVHHLKQSEKPFISVAVITETESEEAKEAISLVKSREIDLLQLHGFQDEEAESFILDKDLRCLPHFFAISILDEKDLSKFSFLTELGEPRILLDSRSGEKTGGTGKTVDSLLVKKASKKSPLWLAGGITPSNVADIIKDFEVEMIDISSGVEVEHGKKDEEKIKKLFIEIEKGVNDE